MPHETAFLKADPRAKNGRARASPARRPRDASIRDTISKMQAHHVESAERARSLIERGLHDASSFRAALLEAPPSERDAWVDLVLGLGEIPDDGPELPRGCAPYLPCAVDSLLRIVDETPVRATDTFVDLGMGVGRAGALVHLLSGASVIGIEIQPRLAAAARDLAAHLPGSRISVVEGDAAQLASVVDVASIFFLYCPFSGARLAKVLADLEPVARARTIRICCVDLPLPECAWLTLESAPSRNPAIYRSNFHESHFEQSGNLGASAST